MEAHGRQQQQQQQHSLSRRRGGRHDDQQGEQQDAQGQEWQQGEDSHLRGEQQQQQQQQQQRDGFRRHQAEMKAAFQRSQASRYAQWDLWAGISLSVLLLLALPSTMQREHWRPQLAAFLAEAAFRVLPAWLATVAGPSYLPRRTLILSICRVASVLVPRLVVQPPLPVGPWGGWPQLLLFTRVLGANTMPWLARLPFKWFALVHLVGVADALRASLAVVCTSPTFAGAGARAQYAALARSARVLAAFAPIPALQRPGHPSCLEALVAAPDSFLGAAEGICACRQVSLWLVAVAGYALPMALQYLSEVGARRRFYRQHCRRSSCEGCANAKGADLLLLGASAALLLLGFCAAAWQFAASVFLARDTAADLAATPASIAVGNALPVCTLPGGCPSSL